MGVMQEIRCPNCGEVFQVDETGYAQIAQQVRDEEFKKELARREQELAEKQEDKLKFAQMQQEKEYGETLSQKKAELAEKEKTIEQLKAQITSNETEKKLAISEAVREKEKEQEAAVSRKNDELAKKEREIEQLKAQLAGSETEKKLAVAEAVQKKEQEIAEGKTEIITLKGKLSAQETEIQLKEKSLKEQYEEKLKSKDEQIEYYKDFKARQSTKMIGESLEQHCLTQFNTIRMTAFPTAYFEKDNDARTGSKGDFIFRESSEDGTEFISIMFEMKNEADPPPRSTRTRIFSRNWIRTGARNTVNTRCWFLCWRSTTSITTTALWTFPTNMRKCMLSVRNSLSPSSRYCATRPSTLSSIGRNFRSSRISNSTFSTLRRI